MSFQLREWFLHWSFHFAIGFAVAWVLRGNLIASAFGTFVGNPLTFPFIWIATYDVGYWVLQGAEAPSEPGVAIDMVSGAAYSSLLPVLVPMLVGGIPLGLVVSGVVYYLTRSTVETYQSARRERLAARASQSVSGKDGPVSTSEI